MGPKKSRAPESPATGKRKLPPKPSSACQTCWEGPFAAHLGLFDQKKPLGRAKERSLEGYAYSTSHAQLERGSSEGCVWCGFLLVFQSKHVDTHVSKPLKTKGPLKITVGKAPDRFAHTRYTPANLQELRVTARGHDGVFYGYLYAAAGGLAHASSQRGY